MKKLPINFHSTFKQCFLKLVILILICEGNSRECYAVNASQRDYFIALCYHDVRENIDKDFDSDSILLADLVNQFQWLKENGYHPVSVNDLIAAQKGQKELPDKAVLITFDDGYISFYEKVFPLLKAFHYPAVLGIVGSWIDTPHNHTIAYDGQKMNRDNFMTWSQIKEVSDSGLVEIANHSYDHHKGVLANPQGSKEPEMTTLQYDPKLNTYETTKAFKKDIYKDLKKNSDGIFIHTGKHPRIMVWPYDGFNEIGIDMAKSLGLSINFLHSDSRKNKVADLTFISRSYYSDNEGLVALIDALNRWDREIIRPIRSIRINLNDLYDKDPARMEDKLSKLVERIHKYQISTVFLQTSETNEQGTVSHVYFPNRHLPMKADLMNRVTWQLHTRAGVQVYAWMPITDFNMNEKDHHKILEIYEDLASHVPFDGLALYDNSHSFSQDTDFSFAQEIINTVKRYRPEIKTTRRLFISSLQKNELQLLEQYAKNYDFVTLTPMPNKDRCHDSREWLTESLDVLESHPELLKHVLYELQSVDPQNCEPISPEELVREMRKLQAKGVINFGYAPDHFLNNQPNQAIVNEGISMSRVLYVN